MKIKKEWYLAFLCIILLFLTGCFLEKGYKENNELQEMETVRNLFVSEETELETVSKGEIESESTDVYARQGSIGHGFENLLTDKSEKGYLLYEGGESHLDYFVQASGTSDIGMGIMLFVDGIPQPFYTDEDSDYAYMHRFYPEDEQIIQTTFHFIPVTGQAGDRLEIKTLSIWYPDFAPDMVDTFYFGNFHSMMDPKSQTMQFEGSSEKTDSIAWPETEDRLSSAETAQEELTIKARDYALGRYGWSAEDLETNVLSMFYIDGIDMYNLESYDISEKDKLHLRVELMGCPLAECGVTFYLDHEPVSSVGVCSFEARLSQGMISVVEADIDVSDLEGIHVLYALMIPKNEIDMSEAGNFIRLMNTRSVALYDHSELPERGE